MVVVVVVVGAATSSDDVVEVSGPLLPPPPLQAAQASAKATAAATCTGHVGMRLWVACEYFISISWRGALCMPFHGYMLAVSHFGKNL